jgi:hypothetical protein
MIDEDVKSLYGNFFCGVVYLSGLTSFRASHSQLAIVMEPDLILKHAKYPP